MYQLSTLHSFIASLRLSLDWQPSRAVCFYIANYIYNNHICISIIKYLIYYLQYYSYIALSIAL